MPEYITFHINVFDKSNNDDPLNMVLIRMDMIIRFILDLT